MRPQRPARGRERRALGRALSRRRGPDRRGRGRPRCRVAEEVPRRDGDRGSAVVEFLGVSLLLLVPLVYLILTLGRVQAAAFAAEGAAREAGRIIAQAESWTQGSARARAAVELAFADQGLAVDGAAALSLTCEASPCLTPGAQVTVEVAAGVDLPLVPDALGAAVPVTVPVSATHVAVVSRFREAAP